jgi:hypothetical protein
MKAQRSFETSLAVHQIVIPEDTTFRIIVVITQISQIFGVLFVNDPALTAEAKLWRRRCKDNNQ